MEKDIEFLYEMFPIERKIIFDTYISLNKDIDNTISSLIKLCNTISRYPPSYEEAVNNGIGSSSNITNDGELSKKRKDSRRNLGKKEWKPPILGKLSDDFLNVASEILSNSSFTGFSCKGCSKLMPIESNDDSSVSQIASVTSSMAISNFGDIDTIIRRRMEDNVCQTRYATMGMNFGPDNIQYLDDERLALMLQNQEFRSMVKADPEFQKALQDDNKEEQESEDIVEVWQERDDSIRFSPHEFGADYGYERSSIVDPDEPWPDRAVVSPNHDVTKMVKAMGKASRKRLGSIAKRFSSIRRHKSSRNYADVDSFAEFAPITTQDRWETESTRGLLMSEEDSGSYMEPRRRSDRHPMSVISERSAHSTLT